MLPSPPPSPLSHPTLTLLILEVLLKSCGLFLLCFLLDEVGLLREASDPAPPPIECRLLAQKRQKRTRPLPQTLPESPVEVPDPELGGGAAVAPGSPITGHTCEWTSTFLICKMGRMTTPTSQGCWRAYCQAYSRHLINPSYIFSQASQ